MFVSSTRCLTISQPSYFLSKELGKSADYVMLAIGSRSYHISEKSMILLLICNWLLYILIHLTFVFHVKVIHKGLISKQKSILFTYFSNAYMQTIYIIWNDVNTYRFISGEKYINMLINSFTSR